MNEDKPDTPDESSLAPTMYPQIYRGRLGCVSLRKLIDFTAPM